MTIPDVRLKAKENSIVIENNTKYEIYFNKEMNYFMINYWDNIDNTWSTLEFFGIMDMKTLENMATKILEVLWK
jgi:hypothetical protein